MYPLTVSSRATQGNLLLGWKISFVSTKNRADRDILQQRCPSLLAMFHMTINRLSPKEFGKFLGVTRKCAMQLDYWLMTSSSDSQLFSDCTRLRDYFYIQCPHDVILDMGNGALQEMALYMRELKQLEPIRFPDRKESEDDWHYYHRFSDALFDELQMAFHATYHFGQFVSMSREYRREMLLQIELAPRSAPTVPIPSEVPTETSLRSSEARVPLSEFCKTINTFPIAETCPVCTEDIKDKAEGETVVVTKCGHHYHCQCLDSWVNDSLQNNSNTCPACRAVLCQHRWARSYVS